MNAILFESAAVLLPDRDELVPDTHVLVEGGRIAEVSDRPIGASRARRIDARGKTLMPGLIDAHVHVTITTMDLAGLEHRPKSYLSQEARVLLEAMLARGFTTVRDAAGADRGLAEAVECGLIRGPRIFPSGRALSQTGGHGDFRPRSDSDEVCACSVYTSAFSHVVDGVDAVRKAAREELRQGATQIKIMASGGVASPNDPVWSLQYSTEELEAIVEEATHRRTYTLAHAYTAEAIQHAVRAGVRTIEHGNLIDAETAKLMVERDAFLVPTLVTYDKLSAHGVDMGFPEVSLRKLGDVLEAGRGSLEIARDAGLAMGFGTDLLGEMHPYQSEEFRIRGEVLTPREVIDSATRVNAAILGESGELGVVKAGARADLILVDGDPLRDLNVLAAPEDHLRMVVKAGEVMIDRGSSGR